MTHRSPASIGARERRARVDARRHCDRSSNSRAKRGIVVSTEAKFSGLQSLENAQNAERISIFRLPARLPAERLTATRPRSARSAASPYSAITLTT
jgi:hypothetical protein